MLYINYKQFMYNKTWRNILTEFKTDEEAYLILNKWQQNNKKDD